QSTRVIDTLSLHDALPISRVSARSAVAHIARDQGWQGFPVAQRTRPEHRSFPRGHPPVAADLKPRSPAGMNDALAEAGAIEAGTDRKSTRLNSSHVKISYA